MIRLVLLVLLTLSLSGSALSQEHQHHHKKHDFSDAQKWIERFEDPTRDVWQKPDLVVEQLGLKPGMNVADIGAASGYFTRRMATKIVPGGFALAVDIEAGFFPYVLERAYQEGLYNLFTVQCTETDPRLPRDTIDLILIVDTLHHIEHRQDYYEKLKESLRERGRIVVVDFKKDAEIPVGPKKEMRLSAESVRKEFETAGFQVTVDASTLPYQYILTARI